MAIGCLDGPHHHWRCVPYRLIPFVRINRRGLGFRHQRSAILRGLSVHGANAIQDSIQGRLFVSAILIGCLPVVNRGGARYTGNYVPHRTYRMSVGELAYTRISTPSL